MYTLYGIPNCDSVKKARTFLEANSIPYTFHDYKKEGISKAKLTQWSKQLGWENLINKNSTTWKELDEAIKNDVTTQAAAINVMMEYTSAIKRPIIMKDDAIVAIRFNEAEYQKVFL
ncbi:ArsC family reductase [Taibaiella lutea]|uniref:ArsC family reductase n=1 Tax=Taibaiella lutea TaxID=2608001 RepID=A0A5M6CHP8_9BACT|nr:ArsC family reductase [Taibaiella lutea]KAA5533462.1 ArsC family reductase [Taibaiella lutea]